MKLKDLHTDCRVFNGYKPCAPSKVCLDCNDYDSPKSRVLLIHLGALGAVLRSTALLPVIRKKYPDCKLTWLTEKSARPLLAHNPMIDQILDFDAGSIQAVLAQKFDVVINLEKAIQACAVAQQTQAKTKLGFGLNETGAIVPLNKGAQRLYLLGLDDQLKFFKNTCTENEAVCELLEAPYERDEYILNFTHEEKKFVANYKRQVGIKQGDFVIGFNTGCSNLFSLKKLPVDQQVELIKKLQKEFPKGKFVLLGGREDTERNQEIETALNGTVINTPSSEGLRRGILYEDICDLIVTGDTLGLHIAIALKKKTVVWFGLSCANEIELYDRGKKVLSPVPCRPCWKKTCDFEVLCNEVVDLDEMVKAVQEVVAHEVSHI